MKATQLSSETLDRAHERFEETLAQMTVAEANTMPAPLIKSDVAHSQRIRPTNFRT